MFTVDFSYLVCILELFFPFQAKMQPLGGRPARSVVCFQTTCSSEQYHFF